MENTDFSQIAGLLATPATILLTTHTNPDGDALGSVLALGRYLKKKGHTVSMMVPDPYPSFLSWMEGMDDLLVFSLEKERCKSIIHQADLIFALDFNDLSRLQEAEILVKQSPATKILIDHHLYPSDCFRYKISIAQTSSTSELVFDFIVASGDSHLLDKTIATAIYAGITTDTGSFSYSCNSVHTYEVVAKLFALGIDGEHIHRLIYDTYSEHRLRLLGFSLSKRLTVLPDLHTAYIYLTDSDLEQFHYQIGDTEGVVNYALSIENIHLAALFTERDHSIRISFRSKGRFSVEKLARDHFNGGGHANASGATSYDTMEETVARFLNAIPHYRNELKDVYA